jgi:hypothetical protein
MMGQSAYQLVYGLPIPGYCCNQAGSEILRDSPEFEYFVLIALKMVGEGVQNLQGILSLGVGREEHLKDEFARLTSRWHRVKQSDQCGYGPAETCRPLGNYIC